jgi:hypothetical protein
MYASTEMIAPRRQRQDRRTKGRLRELCDEVLASYRLAQGQDLLSQEEREFPLPRTHGYAQVLRSVFCLEWSY